MTISEHDLADAANMLRSEFSKELDDIKASMARGPRVAVVRSTDREEIRDIERRLDTLEIALNTLIGIVEGIALDGAR